MNHTFVFLPDQRGSALLSTHNSADTAIIYVHGFWGDFIDTWRDLAYYVDLLPGLPFSNADLYFFNYPAEKDFVITSTGLLRDFVRLVFPQPPVEFFVYPLAAIDWRMHA